MTEEVINEEEITVTPQWRDAMRRQRTTSLSARLKQAKQCLGNSTQNLTLRSCTSN
jgi:hypothetical protein